MVRYLEPGAAYFRPDPARWAGRRLAPAPAAAIGVRPTGLAVVLRPMAVDCDGPANPAAKVAVLRELGVPEVEFYSYGLMRLSSLDRIGAALRS
ncbi:hypothetical protein E6W39_22785 [Kitasatospora acidiphila]|uniref:Uncharacterized protein n=1 Tax=Kitasatospora acidiphila TaxID=2567942 RepID=A0A540W840_9ACTN|nr:hypothetical protein [Kitasatospora acidiphila]TQF04534.1 hypothetical protein E6W39_22785 [Kitasatospora acidiphila]